jgi:hypothetical protein
VGRGRFVSRKFRTRYSGHGLSRLACFGHNTTKQDGFPTTWRESLNGHANELLTWLSKASTFVSMEVDRW